MVVFYALQRMEFALTDDQERRVTEWARTAAKDAVLAVDEDITATLDSRDYIGYVMVTIRRGGVVMYHISYSTRILRLQ